MSNISTASTLRGKDFSYGARGHIEDEFFYLYDEIILKLRELSATEDITHFNIELNKLRNKMKKLINKYFNSSLAQMSSSTHKEAAKDCEKQIAEIIKTFTI